MLPEVIDGNGELIGPMSVPVLCKQVTALLGWRLHLPSEQRIVEDFVSVFQLHTNSAAVGRFEPPPPTSTVVALAADVPSRAFAGINARRFV